jgi:hypothetical protein
MTTPGLFDDDDDPPQPRSPDAPAPPVQQLVLVWGTSRRSAKCRSCGAPLVFAQVVASGKWLPFDADPVAIRTSQDPATRRLVEHLDAADVHFRSCPNADAFRRRG